MDELTLYTILLLSSFLSGMIFFVVLLFITAPYGRYTRPGWGPEINRKLGWALMELPSILVVAFCFVVGRKPNLVLFILFTAWQVHYVHRSVIYPLLLKGKKGMPIGVVAMVVVFNVINSYLQGRWLFTLAPGAAYGNEWLKDPRFVAGLSLFVLGMILNMYSDYNLRNLRSKGAEYRMPHRGMFTWVSCPNYLGEIIEWTGWALATWSLAGLVFAFWTWANLTPRARSHHLWYKEKFPEYPQERKALIPFLF
jgi:3-oxo-5-alpha-steroid 4-dehydrogenase 1